MVCLESIMLSYETYFLVLIIFIVTFFIMVLLTYHASLKVHPCKTTHTETKQMGNSTNLAGKIEHAQFTVLYKAVQDYPARLHASYCATLQRVGYLAR